MNYESFRDAWNHALRESRLPLIAHRAEETLDLQTLDRNYVVYVEPLGGQDAPPFHLTATLSWSWHALQTARAATKDEDILSEMLGRDGAADLETEKPYVRVDIKLSDRAPYGKPLPMPAEGRWAAWERETVERLDNIEPLLPERTLRENRAGMLEVLGWQEAPTATLVCGPGGGLLLEAVEISAGQLIELPRVLDGSDREPMMVQRRSLPNYSRGSARPSRHGCRRWTTCDRGRRGSEFGPLTSRKDADCPSGSGCVSKAAWTGYRDLNDSRKYTQVKVCVAQ